MNDNRDRAVLATATVLEGGIAKCDVCGQIMFEDKRHFHRAGSMSDHERLNHLTIRVDELERQFEVLWASYQRMLEAIGKLG